MCVVNGFENGDAFDIDLVDYHLEGANRTMPMKTPSHVGGVIRREVIEPLDLSVSVAAKGLGVGRQALSNLLNEKAALTSDMALRLEKAFGPRMDHLMRMQLAFELSQARKEERAIGVKRHVVKKGATRLGLS